MVVPRVQAEESHVANVTLEVTLFLVGVLHMSAEYVALPVQENYDQKKVVVTMVIGYKSSTGTLNKNLVMCK